MLLYSDNIVHCSLYELNVIGSYVCDSFEVPKDKLENEKNKLYME